LPIPEALNYTTSNMKQSSVLVSRTRNYSSCAKRRMLSRLKKLIPSLLLPRGLKSNWRSKILICPRKPFGNQEVRKSNFQRVHGRGCESLGIILRKLEDQDLALTQVSHKKSFSELFIHHFYMKQNRHCVRVILSFRMFFRKSHYHLSIVSGTSLRLFTSRSVQSTQVQLRIRDFRENLMIFAWKRVT